MPRSDNPSAGSGSRSDSPTACGVRMRLGHAPAGSSPAVQEDFGLNQDDVLSGHRSEGERLRE